MKRYNTKITLILLLVLSVVVPGFSQQTAEDGSVYVKSLFTYPMAPEYLDNIEARSDWLMDNFWNDMDFKQKVVNQAALIHAFDVYTSGMIYAKKAKVLNSVEALCKKMEKNPTLLTQFMKAAEEQFHSPRSSIYIDEVYRIFLYKFLSNKKIKNERKQKYRQQLAALDATVPGKQFPEGGDGITLPKQGAKGTLVIFGSTADSSMRQILLKFGTSVALERLIDTGDVAIVFVDTNKNEDFEVPSTVERVYCEEPQKVYDLPSLPECYILDGTGVIVGRNMNLANAMRGVGIEL